MWGWYVGAAFLAAYLLGFAIYFFLCFWQGDPRNRLLFKPAMIVGAAWPFLFFCHIPGDPPGSVFTRFLKRILGLS